MCDCSMVLGPVPALRRLPALGVTGVIHIILLADVCPEQPARGTSVTSEGDFYKAPGPRPPPPGALCWAPPAPGGGWGPAGFCSRTFSRLGSPAGRGPPGRCPSAQPAVQLAAPARSRVRPPGLLRPGLCGLCAPLAGSPPSRALCSSACVWGWFQGGLCGAVGPEPRAPEAKAPAPTQPRGSC